jgi:hypothetical protein
MTIEEINRDENSRLELVGFRVDGDATIPQFYVLYDVDSSLPIDHNGFPIIFFSRDKYQEAHALSTCQCENLPIDSDSLSKCDTDYFDIAMAIYEIESLSEAVNVGIVDELNLLLDFVSFLPEDRINMYYKKIMGKAADHFTFSNNIEEFFLTAEFSRCELVLAIAWAVGATALYAKYVY